MVELLRTEYRAQSPSLFNQEPLDASFSLSVPFDFRPSGVSFRAFDIPEVAEFSFEHFVVQKDEAVERLVLS